MSRSRTEAVEVDPGIQECSVLRVRSAGTGIVAWFRLLGHELYICRDSEAEAVASSCYIGVWNKGPVSLLSLPYSIHNYIYICLPS